MHIYAVYVQVCLVAAGVEEEQLVRAEYISHQSICICICICIYIDTCKYNVHWCVQWVVVV